MARILLVEDDRTFAGVAAAALRLVGHIVVEAYNGADALAQMRDAEPAIMVITDLVMPDTEGVGLIMQLRREFPEVKVIAITGGKHPDVYLRIASMLGAEATLAKPFHLQELLALVDRVLGPR
jgi:DNA-binding NtrC family response regulator